MQQKLIFLDIDGTLTPPGNNMPPESAMTAIRQAKKNGHKVFLCTGRNLGMLAPVWNLGLFEGAVASAGGYVYVGDHVLFDCPMTKEQQEIGVRLLREAGVFCTIESRDITWGDEGLEEFFAWVGDANSEIMRWRKAISERLDIRPMKDYDGSPIYKIVIMCKTMEQLIPAREALEKDFNFAVQEAPEFHTINGELINRKFDKGRGIQRIAEYYGMSMADTIGFGDSINDLEMIESVGFSVCMDNGSDFLKSKSDYVCPRVDEDGLYKAFEHLKLL